MIYKTSQNHNILLEGNIIKCFVWKAAILTFENLELSHILLFVLENKSANQTLQQDLYTSV